MPNSFDNFSPKEWEKFCEKMLRQHYGTNNFWPVPDGDRGDHGIEFFTSTGIIFQCYFPDRNVDIKAYKTKIQDKINTDLKKLKKYEDEIFALIDDIKICQWVLLIPENKSSELIKYCNKKKKETVSACIKFIDNDTFKVKIETADSYPKSKIFALSVMGSSINIPLKDISDDDKTTWLANNSEFSKNITRKSDVLMKKNALKFKDRIIEKYIQIDGFLGTIRNDYPDIFHEIEDTARAQLDDSENISLFEENFGPSFVSKIVENNNNAFNKYITNFSDSNHRLLSFGYLSKWIAECYLDFIYEDE